MADEEDIKCVLSRVIAPGSAVMLRIRLTVLKFAQERGWVLTGGWAHQGFLHSVDPLQSVYDSRVACRMSDVDALVVDPLGDLMELASRIHMSTGVQLMVGCGLVPNMFHLKINWGGATLVDAIGVDAPTLNLIPTRTYPMSYLLSSRSSSGSSGSRGKKTIKVLDPVYELSKLHRVVDSAFEASDEDLGKRFARMAILERAIFSPSKPVAGRTATGAARSPLYEALREAKIASLVARIPGVTNPELLVHAADAIDVLMVLVRESARQAPESKVAFYAPFVWANNHSLAVEVDGRLRVYCCSVPIPLARASGTRLSSSSIPMVSNRTAATHLVATASWRHSLGDTVGAQQRAASAYKMMADLALSTAGPVSAYAGRLPSSLVFERYLRRKATKRGCMMHYTTPSEKPADEQQRQKALIGALTYARHSQGAKLAVFDGRLLATHPCSALAASRDALVGAIAAVTDHNVMSDPMMPINNKGPADFKRPPKKKNINKNWNNNNNNNNKKNKKPFNNNNKKAAKPPTAA
jgi:hypothetical protein